MQLQIESVLAGVVANALTSLLARIADTSQRWLFDGGLAEDPTGSGGGVDRLLGDAVSEFAETVTTEGPVRIEEVCLFLMTPEVEGVVRRLYASRLTEGQAHNENAKREFVQLFSMHTATPLNDVSEQGKAVFEALKSACEKSLEIAIDEGLLSAHETKSAIRHALLRDELESIKKNLGVLRRLEAPDVSQILEFESKYRQQVENRHKHIVPPHLDAARKLPVNDIYVVPNFIKASRQKGQEPVAIAMNQFLLQLYRAVLLGNPGGGKSTLASKLCFDLASRYEARLIARRRLTPVLVVLRDYGAEKKSTKCSILEFMEMTSNSSYQLTPPRSAFEYLLRNGRLLVIFDGLDELLDTKYRQQISDDVDSFCSLYPAVPILVTSREIGYEQAPLDPQKFDILRLAAFDDVQVRQYVEKWFAADPELAPKQRQKNTEAFLVESRLVPDLRSNPLMLGLLCNIYRGESYLPRYRPDVYEKCAMMLFERWDKSRGISVPLPFEAHIRPAMMHLAHWIYSDEALQGGASEGLLIAQATEYLVERRFDDRDEAQHAARAFIEFCRGRAWVFTDTGTTRDGESLYQFTHRTFLEYFTAAHLCRTHPTPEQLAEALIARIEKREWDVVAQLAFQIQNKHVERAGDALLLSMLDPEDSESAWNKLMFAVRCLEFMVPSPRVAREITAACIGRAVTVMRSRAKHRAYLTSLHGFGIPAGIGALFYVATENRQPVLETLEAMLRDQLKSAEKRRLTVGLELCLNLSLWPLLYEVRRSRTPQEENFEQWRAISERIADEFHEIVIQMCERNESVAYDYARLGRLPLASLVSFHGANSLMRPRRLWSIQLPPAAASLFADITYRRDPTFFSDPMRALRELGQVLAQSDPPWFEVTQGRSILDEFHFTPRWADQPSLAIQADPDALFGYFVILATFFEQVRETEKGASRTFVRELETSLPARFGSIGKIVASRFRNGDDVATLVRDAGFTDTQSALMMRWVGKDVNFATIKVRQRKPGKKAPKRRR